jgi:quinol-cytochrome oxidoreductase complex cytochrome b subunit
MKLFRPIKTAGPLIPTSDTERKRFPRRFLVLHFRPATVPERTLRFTLTWGLGGTAVVLVVVQLITGILLKFVYEPSPVSAYASIQALMTTVPFGRLIRNLHHWCSHLLVAVAVLHLLRVFFTGAFHPPRQFNWIIGLGLLGTVLAANFTGYLLPWDQLAYWAVTVSTGMLDYVPLIGRIRKAGGLVIPRSPDEAAPPKTVRVPTLPNLLLREVVTALVVLAGVLLFSTFVNAPLGEPANPGLSPNPTKAPWYFAGFQEMLLHIHPVYAVTVLPLFFGVLLVLVPYLKYDSHAAGVWFISVKGRKAALLAAAVALVATPLGVWISGTVLPAATGAVTGGLMPFVVLLSSGGGFFPADQTTAPGLHQRSRSGPVCPAGHRFYPFDGRQRLVPGAGDGTGDAMVKPEKKTRPVREAEPGRRGFFLKIWLGLGVLALGEVVWAVLSYLRPQASGGRQGRKAPLVTAGSVEDFAPNSVTAFPRGQFYLARLECRGLSGHFAALHPFGLHRALGGGRGPLHLPLPPFGVRHSRRRASVAGAPGFGYLPRDNREQYGAGGHGQPCAQRRL